MILQGLKKKDFYARFHSRTGCMEYLSMLKWGKGYQCRKCAHVHYMNGKQPFSRRCKSCKYDESVTGHTLFHKLKFPIEKAFEFLFLITTSRKGMSAKSLSEELCLHYETCINFRRKAQKAMESTQKHPLEGHIEVDETAIGGYGPDSPGRAKGDKKIVAVALEITKDGKFGRAYAHKIEDYSSAELRKIFDRHIGKKAQIRAGKWRGYLPIKETYPKPEQGPSDKRGQFQRTPPSHYGPEKLGACRHRMGIHHHISEQ